MSRSPLYGLSFLLASTLLLVLWRYAVLATSLVRPDAANEEIELLTKRLNPGLAGYLVLICAGLFIPILAVIGYLGIALYDIIPVPAVCLGFSAACDDDRRRHDCRAGIHDRRLRNTSVCPSMSFWTGFGRITLSRTHIASAGPK